jgi:hypothetical protein
MGRPEEADSPDRGELIGAIDISILWPMLFRSQSLEMGAPGRE